VLPRTPVTGRWDPLRINQVITNLLSNAMKYGSAHPIEIEVSAEDGRARVVVRDHGVGIAPEDQDRIFERFERLLPIHHFGGFGLGLWIVKQVAQAHGGEVRVESTPGEGSTFIVELPCETLIESAAAASGEP
jgi:signal transduction histidine kinase